MTQLTRRQYAAIASLILAAGGCIVVACSSDSTPSMSAAPLGPDDGTGTPPATGTGGTTTSPDVGNSPGGATNGGTGTGEANPGDLPIANPEMDPTTPVTETPPVVETPPTTGLQPNCAAPEGPVPALALTPVATNLTLPLFVTGAPGDDSRLFVVEKGGTVRVILNGVLQEQPFINVSPQVTNDNTGERGLLGMAFHPDYATNGLFYLHFSSAGDPDVGATMGDGVVSEFKVSADDRSVADLSSERPILVVDQPQQNHNGGMITFGPDGMLYLGYGDGGGQNDTSPQGHDPAVGNGQALNTVLAKLLRIDVAGREVNGAYGIPPGNLAEVSGVATTRREIWAYGLRNPWRFSFDACGGDLYIGDVGQDQIEEVDYLPAGTAAGTNFGWRLMEGAQCGPSDPNCNRNGLVLPVDSYDHTVGRSITGGYVYRGSNIPGLRGTYIYSNYNAANSFFIRFRMENGQMVDRQNITNQLSPASAPVAGISSFGQDNAGELYVTALISGTVYRITAAAQ